MPDFGYSVGDFIGVGTLVSRTIQCLVDSRDASEDCQLLIDSLRSLDASITAARNTMDATHGTPATVNAIRHELDVCEKLIKDFYADSKVYTESLCNGSDKSFVIREIRKISWTMFKTGDIQRLQRDLQAHLKALGLLVSLLPCEMIQRLQDLKLGAAQVYSVEAGESGSVKSFGSVSEETTESARRMIAWTESLYPGAPSSIYSGDLETTRLEPSESFDSGYASPGLMSMPRTGAGRARYFGNEGVFHDAPAQSVTDGSRDRHYRNEDPVRKTRPPLRDHWHERGSYSGTDSKPRHTSGEEPPRALGWTPDREPSPSPEILKMKAELEHYRDEQRAKAEKEKQAELEDRIRRETEFSVKMNMEAMKKAQAEARVEIERAKEEAEKAARETVEKERRIHEEQRKHREAALAAVEQAARERFEAEMKARMAAKSREEAAMRKMERERLQAERRAEEEARAAAKRKWFRFPRKNFEIGTGNPARSR